MEPTAEQLEAGRGYDALFVPAIFDAWAQRLVARAAIAPAAKVLDVACGTGAFARRALMGVGPLGRVTGVDRAPGMLAAARQSEPRIIWTEASAETLPFAADAFDTIGCQFGLMFFDDPAHAASEMLRVLRPGGGLIVAVWNSLAHNPLYGTLADVLDAEISQEAGDATRLPFRMGDAGALAALFTAAGSTDIQVRAETCQARFPDIETLVQAELRGWLPLFGIVPDEATIARVLTRARDRLAKYAAPDGPAVFDTSALVLTARKA